MKDSKNLLSSQKFLNRLLSISIAFLLLFFIEKEKYANGFFSIKKKNKILNKS